MRVAAREASQWREIEADLKAKGLIAGARVAPIQSEMKPLSPVEPF